MKKYFAFILALGILLSGCRLATDEVNNSGMMNRDELVGVVVTTEHLDLFDMEAYLRDNPDDLLDGEIGGNTSAYQNRIWAQEEIEHSTTEDGVPCTTTYYNFDHVDGMCLLDYQTKTILEDGSILSEMSVGDCSDGILSVAYLGDLIEGTIYVPKGSGEVCVFTNPVYQDSEGRLYLVAGTGISTDELLGSMSQTITEEYTETINGEITTRKREVKITVEGADVPDKVAIVQMSGENTVLDRQEYAPEDLPETLTPMEECAYILVEESAGEEMKRSMIEPGINSIMVFVRSDRIYCAASGTEILWRSE